MPQQNTLNAASEPDPTGDGTLGWILPHVGAGQHPIEESTLTRTTPSTPGPGDPARHTKPEATEPIEQLDSDGQVQMPEISGYYVEKLLGRGGMGVVYRAIDLTLNRVVALKVLHPGSRSYQHVLGRFRREVTALAAIDHPNIVRIYDADDWHGFPYFTMQYVRGGPLSHHLSRFRGDPRACARLVAKVARAVQVLHSVSVIHRDLKPLNILLGDNDEPMVADFGLAKWLDDDPQPDYSVTGHPVGTRQYMAPEQTLGKRSGYAAACDIWALGIVLYEMLAGRRPFADDGKSDLLKRIREEPMPTLPDDVPSDLAAVIEKCLSKNPVERYTTAAEVADDLERWRAGEPVSVSRSRKRRAWVGGLALAAVMALIVVPAAVIPRGRTVEQPTMTAAGRIASGETIFLTDKDGRPTMRVKPLAQYGLVEIPRNGTHIFSARETGMAELINEPLPFPVRVECEVEVPLPAASTKIPHGGIYIGERAWLDGPVVHHSAVWIVIAPHNNPELREAKMIEFRCELFQWAEAKVIGTSGLRIVNVPWGRATKQDDQPRPVTLAVEIHPSELRLTLDGKVLPPVPTERITMQLRHQVKSDRRLLNDPIPPPVLGDGIGITVNDTEVTVRNLRLTRVSP